MNDSPHKRNKKFLISTLMIIAAAALSSNFTILKLLQQENFSTSDVTSNPHFDEPSSEQNGLNYNICPSALRLFDNRTELINVIEKQIHFHRKGGNLASIEEYLNKHMQNTVDRLGVEFIPEGETLPVNDSIKYLQDYYKSHQVKRGGYGQPLPGKLRGENVDKVLFEKRWFDVIEPYTSERYRASMGHVGPSCSNLVHFAEGSYEEKLFCVDAVKDTVSNDNTDGEAGNPETDSTTCSIFSIGSNDEWGFENEVIKKLPHCVTHTFDCTLKDNTPRKKPLSDNVQFHPYCIGSGNAQPPYMNYEQLFNETGSASPPKLLKMDVEGFEFDTILNSVLAASNKIYPEQIMMEVHWATRMVDIPWMFRNREAAEVALFFGSLFNHGGYIPVLTKFFDPYCGPCMEVLMIRVLCD
ncbi:hypothetical protein ACHAXS_002589 [Conticribra weissflogii]